MVKAQSPKPESPISNPQSPNWLLIVILVLAACVRLYRLEAIPPGFTHDEAGHGHDAVAILHGARPIYETVGYGREPLYDYWIAGLMALGGPNGFVLRFSAVPFGLLTLLLTYAWVRLAFDRPTALAAVALQAASFWSLTTARQALRSGLLPALFALAAYFYWHGVFGTRVSRMNTDRNNRICRICVYPCPFLLFAVCIGAMLVTYFPARVVWVVFLVFLLYLALVDRATLRRAGLPVLAAIALGWLLAAPMFAWLRQHPGAEQRLAMLATPLEALRRGDVSNLLNRVWGGLAAFFVPGRGDDFLAYTIPGRPFFDPPTGMLFLAGVALCLAQWRKPACAFALLWFVVGISPTLVTGAPASITRSISALPVAFLFPALAVVAGARWAAGRWRRKAAWAVGAAFAALVAVTGFISARDYFVVWGESPDVRAAYQHTLVEAARYLDAQPEGGTVAVSSVYPLAPHDPYVFEMSLRRQDRLAGSRQSLSPRWFDGRRALLIPPERSARLVAPFSASLDPYFANLPGLSLRERVMQRPNDLDPFFAVYDWSPQETLTALHAQTQPLSADFGGVLQLVGTDLRTPEVAPGGTVELVTLWKVTRPPDTELVLFTHALDATGAVVGQEDRLDAPSWDWVAGDAVAQIHRFTLPADLMPGPLALEVGVYGKADLIRLPVVVGGAAVGDRVLLQAVEVMAR